MTINRVLVFFACVEPEHVFHNRVSPESRQVIVVLSETRRESLGNGADCWELVASVCQQQWAVVMYDRAPKLGCVNGMAIAVVGEKELQCSI